MLSQNKAMKTRKATIIVATQNIYVTNYLITDSITNMPILSELDN